MFKLHLVGVLREKNPATQTEDEEEEESEIDPLQPIKRRRITSVDSSSDHLNYRKRIMCRPPIRRMLNNS